MEKLVVKRLPRYQYSGKKENTNQSLSFGELRFFKIINEY